MTNEKTEEAAPAEEAEQVEQVEEAPGEQSGGTCAHASADGTQCCALGCPIPDVLEVATTLQEARELIPGVRPGPDRPEIVRLYGELQKPRLVGEKGEEELTVTVKISGEGLSDEYRYLRRSAGDQVLTIVYSVQSPTPSDSGARLDQPGLFPGDDGEGEGPPVVEVLCCPECARIIRAEGQMPDQACPACTEGTLEIRYMTAGLHCNNCGQEPELVTADFGGTCTLCGEGQYALPATDRSEAEPEEAEGQEHEPDSPDDAESGEQRSGDEEGPAPSESGEAEND